MSNLTQNNAELLKFDGKPSWGAAFPQAMQHVLAMLIGNITPPMLIAGTCGLSAEEKIMLTQAAMIIGGITTLLQLFPVFGFGMKMPNVMGVAFAYMPILTIIGQQYGIAAIFGSQLVAGFVSIFVGMFIGKIRKFFPPIVSGTVVMSIGLSLYKTAISYIGGGSAAQARRHLRLGQILVPGHPDPDRHPGLQLLRQGAAQGLGYADRHCRGLCGRPADGRRGQLCGL